MVKNILGKKQCGFCGGWYHSTSLKRHQKEQHSGIQTEFKCGHCQALDNETEK